MFLRLGTYLECSTPPNFSRDSILMVICPFLHVAVTMGENTSPEEEAEVELELSETALAVPWAETC